MSWKFIVVVSLKMHDWPQQEKIIASLSCRIWYHSHFQHSATPVLAAPQWFQDSLSDKPLWFPILKIFPFSVYNTITHRLCTYYNICMTEYLFGRTGDKTHKCIYIMMLPKTCRLPPSNRMPVQVVCSVDVYHVPCLYIHQTWAVEPNYKGLIKDKWN